MKRTMLVGIAGILLAGLLGIAAGIAFIYSGIYNVAATRQHTAPVYWAIHTAMIHSVRRRADDVPPMPPPTLLFEPGLWLYQSHCVQCHGAPGVAPEPFALGMTPVPGSLVQAAREWRIPEIYWTVKHGIKMTGMPAWEFRLDDTELWAVVAFVACLPVLSPKDYQTMIRSGRPGVEGLPLSSYCAERVKPDE